MHSSHQWVRQFSFGILILAATLAGCSGGGGGGGAGSNQNANVGTFNAGCGAGQSTGNGLVDSCTTEANFNTSSFVTALAEEVNSVEFQGQTPEFAQNNANSGITVLNSNSAAQLPEDILEAKNWLASLGATNSHDTINLQYALALGLTGKGQTIAIHDETILPGHQEFKGDTKLTVTGSVPAILYEEDGEDAIRNHGTAVAGIAAANRDDGTALMGVASGADIMFSSFRTTAFGAEAIRSATGSIAINNSWGFIRTYNGESNYTRTLKYYISNLDPGEVPDGYEIDESLVNRTEQFRIDEALVGAFADFLRKGNVVKSISNNEHGADEREESAEVLAALPELRPDILLDENGARVDGAWVAVGNAIPTFDNAGNITSVSRASAQCRETAAYCLYADGYVVIAQAGKVEIDGADRTIRQGEDIYGFGTGTSYAAPQVTGAIAVLAEAFTDSATGQLQLKPRDLADRLFASANNTYHVKANAVLRTGTDGIITDDDGNTYHDFGNGILHGYNEEYGHGFLDIRAALLPIGELGVTRSSSLDGGTQSIASAQVFTSSSVGNALVNSLVDTQLATFDALGAPFYIPAASLIKIDVDDANSFGEELERFAKAGSFMSSEPGDLTDGWQQAFGGAPLATLGNGFMLSPEKVAIAGNYQPEKGSGAATGGWRFHSGSTSVMAQGFGLAPVADEVFANSISILPTDGVSYGAVQVGETSSLGAFAFVEDAGGRFESTGFAFARASALPGGGLGTLGLVMKSEDYAFMGLKSGTSETDDFSGLAGALNLSVQWILKEDFLGRLSNSGSIFFNAEYGVAKGEGAGLVQGFDTTTFSGFAVGLRFNEVLNDSDTLTLSVRQPLRVESGAANFRFSRGRDLERNVAFNDFAASLSPDARQIDFGARYGWNVDASTRVNIGGYYSMNENHIAGEEGGAVMLAISKKF